MASANEVYNILSKDTKDEKTVRREKCCGISNRGFAICITFIEIGVSLAGLSYAIYGIFTFPEYNTNIVLQDKMFVEARKKLPLPMEKIPEALLFVDVFIFLTELFLAFTLMTGVLKKSAGRVQFWLSAMLTYTLIVTGIALGFIIGGIHSNYLNFLAFANAFFRFCEIGIIYAYYEVLRADKREKRILFANNNLDAVENAEAPQQSEPDVTRSYNNTPTSLPCDEEFGPMQD